MIEPYLEYLSTVEHIRLQQYQNYIRKSMQYMDGLDPSGYCNHIDNGLSDHMVIYSELCIVRKLLLEPTLQDMLKYLNSRTRKYTTEINTPSTLTAKISLFAHLQALHRQLTNLENYIATNGITRGLHP